MLSSLNAQMHALLAGRQENVALLLAALNIATFEVAQINCGAHASRYFIGNT